MKGIVFNLLEQFITDSFGEEKYEEILSQCTLKTKEPFVGPGSYPDDDLMAIVSKSVELLGIDIADALRKFGRYCFLKLAEKFPDFVRLHNHPKPFLKTVESIIHVEVRKLLKDAKPPEFVYDESDPDNLIIKYQSKRKLCQFMEGMIEGVGDYYKSPIQYKQNTCMLEDGDVCEFDLTFIPK